MKTIVPMMPPKAFPTRSSLDGTTVVTWRNDHQSSGLLIEYVS